MSRTWCIEPIPSQFWICLNILMFAQKGYIVPCHAMPTCVIKEGKSLPSECRSMKSCFGKSSPLTRYRNDKPQERHVIPWTYFPADKQFHEETNQPSFSASATGGCESTINTMEARWITLPISGKIDHPSELSIRWDYLFSKIGRRITD